MADLSITAANVQSGSSARTQSVTAGASVTAGQAVYQDTNDANNEHKPADAGSQANSVVAGIALHASEDGQPLEIQTSGDIDLGATLNAGEIYVLSTTSGGIMPATDLTSGDYTTVLGAATASDNLDMNLIKTETQYTT